MSEILRRLSECVEAGKANAASAYPPQLKGQPGADELCREALAAGARPSDVLEQALVPAMARIGEKFSRGEAFVPEMLLAARAMTAAMVHLRPYFASGEVKRRGVFVIGTVAGDLHDIGKNIVAMMLESAGFRIVDLGADVTPEKIVEAVRREQANFVALSALLTTTMVNMKAAIEALAAAGLRDKVKVLLGGAPVTQAWAQSIGADGYGKDAMAAVELARQLAG